MKKSIATTLMVLSFVGLTACASTSPASQPLRSQALHDGRASGYVGNEACYKQGYYDANFATKAKMALDFLTENNNYDKNYLNSKIVEYRNSFAQNPNQIDKGYCQDLQLALNEMILNLENMKAEQVERQRNAAIRESGKTTINSGFSTPKQTSCMTFGNMVNCTQF